LAASGATHCSGASQTMMMMIFVIFLTIQNLTLTVASVIIITVVQCVVQCVGL